MEKYSCWEDAIYSVTGQSSFDYNIYNDNNELIYTGRGYQRPNNGSININISQIVRNYLNSTLPATAFSNNGTDLQIGENILPYATMGFTLADAKGNVLETYKFLNCWDYATRYMLIDNATMNFNINRPINDHTAVGQYAFRSILTKTDKVKVTISSVENATSCGGYGALYYSNSLGGWDSFLIEGRVIKKSTYSKYNIDNNAIAGTLSFGHRTINNTISDSWELQTQYMTDKESQTMALELFGSNNVYWHDFSTDKVIPVIITDNSVEYKTYKNQGKKHFIHKINIKASQDKMRI